MATSNREKITKMIDLLVDGLYPFIKREIRATMGEKPLEQQMPENNSHDLAELLKLMEYKWNEVFRNILGRSERSFVSELRDVRNKWAHNEPFSYGDTHRAIDTAARLLKSIHHDKAEELSKLSSEVLRISYDEQRRSKTRGQSQATLDIKVLAKSGLIKWRDVVTPQKDVRSGTFAQAQFAAD